MVYETVKNGEVVKVKKCIHCQKYKRVDSFYKNVNRCRVCLAKYRRKWRQKKKIGEC